MKVTLRTLCGCERKIEIPDGQMTLTIPYPTDTWRMGRYDMMPRISARRFAWTWQEAEDGTPVFLECFSKEP